MHWAPAVGGARGSWAVGLSQGWQRALGLGDNCSCPSPVCWIGLCYRCHRRPQAKGVPTEPGRLWAHSPRAARNPGRAGPRDSGTALVPGPISPLGSASLSLPGRWAMSEEGTALQEACKGAGPLPSLRRRGHGLHTPARAALEPGAQARCVQGRGGLSQSRRRHWGGQEPSVCAPSMPVHL